MEHFLLAIYFGEVVILALLIVIKRDLSKLFDCKKSIYPDRCPITWKPLFGTAIHPEHGLIPTYGSDPIHTYTIPKAEEHDIYSLFHRVTREKIILYYQQYDHVLKIWSDKIDSGYRIIPSFLLEELRLGITKHRKITIFDGEENDESISDD